MTLNQTPDDEQKKKIIARMINRQSEVTDRMIGCARQKPR